MHSEIRCTLGLRQADATSAGVARIASLPSIQMFQSAWMTMEYPARHVSHLKAVPSGRVCEYEVVAGFEEEPLEGPLRRSARERRPPAWHQDYDMV